MTALAPGQKFGGWQIVHVVDSKRLWVACARCERTQQVSSEAFLDRSLRACGCSSRPSNRTV
jgi:hypothetical protein